ncbi:unnamed protein product [Caenorhabditis nigoni]
MDVTGCAETVAMLANVFALAPALLLQSSMDSTCDVYVPLLQRAIEPERVFGDEGQDPRAWPHVVPLFDPVVVDVFAPEEEVLQEVREEHVGHEEDPVMGEWLEDQQLNDRGQCEEEEEVENIDLRGPRRAPIMLDQLREMIPKLVEISECAACKQIVQEGKVLHCGHCLCDPCLNQHLQYQRRQRVETSCPMCRTVVKPGDIQDHHVLSSLLSGIKMIQAISKLQ